MVVSTRIIHIVLWVSLLFAASRLHAAGHVVGADVPDDLFARVLMDRLFAVSPHYADTLSEFRAELYTRGRFRVYRRNRLIRWLPSMFRFRKGVDDYLTESVSQLHFVAPDVYNMKVRLLTGTFSRNRSELGGSSDYLYVNVYSPTLLPDRLVSPLDRRGARYYDYRVDAMDIRNDTLQYRIAILPRNRSTQLVSGYMVVNAGSWTIDEISLSGKVEHLSFTLFIEMGTRGLEAFLPRKINLSLLYNFLGNRIGGEYSTTLRYDSLAVRPPSGHAVVESSPADYDLTNAYLLKCDTTRLSADTLLMAHERPYPLTAEEQRLYTDFAASSRQSRFPGPADSHGQTDFLNEVGDALIGDHTIRLANSGNVYLSPLVNPLMLSYSHTYGLSYSMQFRYNRLFRSEKWLRVTPRLGYNFTHGEFYWQVHGDFYYLPERLGRLSVRVGNGNRLYTNRVLQALKTPSDSLVDFGKLHLDYFYDEYLHLANQVEVANGLELMAGISFHRREAVNPSELAKPDEILLAGKIDGLKRVYRSFAPRAKVIWTPGLYYYMNGRRKVRLRSHYPTFSLDFERSIKGLFGSSSEYERLELDIQQRVPLSLMSALFWRVGGGMFTNRSNAYFVDYENFNRTSLPVGWNDEIGGVFQLLDRHWFNSSDHYLRTHLTYEAPFLLLPLLSRKVRIVDSERLYLSTLFTDRLAPYVELGYGVGTHIFDVGVFVNNLNGKFSDFGCKFTFELFK